MLPIDKDETGRPELYYSQVFRTFQKWLNGGTILNVFENSVLNLHHENLLDTTVTHGDGTTTMAKKGCDCLGVQWSQTKNPVTNITGFLGVYKQPFLFSSSGLCCTVFLSIWLLLFSLSLGTLKNNHRLW